MDDDKTRRRLSIGDVKLNQEQFSLNIQIMKYLNQFTVEKLDSLTDAASKYCNELIDNSGSCFVNSGQNYLALAKALLSYDNNTNFNTRLTLKVGETKFTSKPTRIQKTTKNQTVYVDGNHRYSWNELSEQLNNLAGKIRQCYEKSKKLEERQLTTLQHRLLGHRLLAIGILDVIFVNTNSEILKLSVLSNDVLQNFVNTVHQFLSLSLVIETYRLSFVLPIWLIDIISIARGDTLADGQPLTFFNMFTYVVENENGSAKAFYHPKKETEYHGYIVLSTEKNPNVSDARQSQRGLHIATCSQQFRIIKTLYDEKHLSQTDNSVHVRKAVFRNIRRVEENERDKIHHDRHEFIGAILASNSVARFFEVALITSKDANYKVQQFSYILDKLFLGKKIPLVMLASVLTLEALLKQIKDQAMTNIINSISTLTIDTTNVPTSYKKAFSELKPPSAKLKQWYSATFNGHKIYVGKNANSIPTPWWYIIDDCYQSSSFYSSLKEAIEISYQDVLSLISYKEKFRASDINPSEYSATVDNHTILIAKDDVTTKLWCYSIDGDDCSQNVDCKSYEESITNSYKKLQNLMNEGEDITANCTQEIDLQTLLSIWEIKQVKKTCQWLGSEQNKMDQFILMQFKQANINTDNVNILTPIDANLIPGWITQELTKSIYEHMNQKHLYSVIPVNFSNAHWLTIVIKHNHADRCRPTVYLFDSLGLNDTKIETLTSIIKHTGVYTNPMMINLSNDDAAEEPLQKDGYTCGTWMLESTKTIIAGLKAESAVDAIKQSIQEISSLDLVAIHNKNLKALADMENSAAYA